MYPIFPPIRLFLAALLLGFRLSTTALAVSADELIQQGEPFDKRFEARQALQLYLAAEKLEPKNADVLVRIARQYRHLMADASAKAEKLRLGRAALDYSQRASLLAPNDPEAQLSIAITLGKMMPFLTTREQVEASPRIKDSVDKTLQLDARNDTAWHILGRWHRVLADVGGIKRALAGAFYGRLPIGSNEEAERDLQKAISLNPNRLMHYIELGRIYAQMGRKDDARRLINKGLAMPDAEKDDPETKERGRETLAKLR